ncbi:MAG: serine hydrolase [Rhodospirillales bacterium]
MLSLTGLRAEAPTIDPTSDAEHFGPPEALLFWTPAQKVAGFRNMDRLVWTREIAAGAEPLPLPSELRDLGGTVIREGGREMTLDRYLEIQDVAGLLVIDDGTVVFEYYGLGNSAESRWLSFSVTKSLVSLLVGAAIREGYIESVEEPVTDYLPRLKGSAYDQASIRDILQMSSGVAWNEDYGDPNSDIARMEMSTLGLYDQLREKPAVAPPGKRFNYNTAETNLVGTLLRSAIGNNLSTYLSETIWQPYGMEANANWMLGASGGGEVGGCCISAILRDYGRIGLFALNEGRLPDGTQVLPEDWMARSTAPTEGYEGYGYLWWRHGGARYGAQGIFGQEIYIDPENRIVIALQSARATADKPDDWALQQALFRAVTQALSD